MTLPLPLPSLGVLGLRRAMLPCLGLLGLLIQPPLLGSAVAAEVQLRCEGTLLEARGAAERQRPLARLAFSLSLEAVAPTADGALGQLQARLAELRTVLRELEVMDLVVGSPSTWQRSRDQGGDGTVQASLSASGRLAPNRLQGLVRRVGGLAGVRLAPVSAEADPAGAEASRRALLAAAYRDAEAQVRPLAQLIGRPRLVPLQIQLEGGAVPILMRTAAAEAPPPPFDPGELAKPIERLGVQVQFCALGPRP
jgi:hypothetical protein